MTCYKSLLCEALVNQFGCEGALRRLLDRAPCGSGHDFMHLVTAEGDLACVYCERCRQKWVVTPA